MWWRTVSSWRLSLGRLAPSNWIARDPGRSRRAWTVALAIAGVASVGLTAHAFDVHVNWTESMPVGVYQRVDAQLERGSWVVFCLDGEPAEVAFARGYVIRGTCPSGVQSIFKRIAAIPGDRVEVGARGVAINGAPVQRSALRQVDFRGRPLTPFSRGESVLPEGRYFVLGTNLEHSWDSRYFGPIEVSQITGSAAPVWTF